MPKQLNTAIIYVSIFFCTSWGSIPCLAQPAASQTSPMPNAQVDPASIVARAKTAFATTAGISEVTLSGQVHFIEGSLDQQGTITLVAGADGSYRIDYNVPKSPKEEAQTSFQSDQTCSWTDNSGMNHPVVQHNCMTGVAWFMPTLAMFGGQQPVTVSFSSTGPSLRNEITLINLRQSATFNSPHSATLMTHLSTVDLFLSQQTYLPTIAKFAVHPDNSSNVDIPVEVTYADYRTISGVAIPFRIQKFLNGTLILDISVSSATIK